MKKIEIYTDGACSGNPGPGGYAAILKYGDHRREVSGGFARSTNNRMEIFAAVAALEALKEPCEITLYSDSTYLVNAVKEHWLANWRGNHWRGSDKKPIKNIDLWKRLSLLLDKNPSTFVWVKGHSDSPENNRCDELSRTALGASDLPSDPGFEDNEDSGLFGQE